MTQQPIGNPEQPYVPKTDPVVGEIYHLPTGIKVTAEQMNDAIADARIVYVGETHDNPAAHRLELQVLQAVVERYPGQVSLGMEMFNPTQQEILDRWVKGELDEKSFLKEVKWFSSWKMDFAYYADILNYAREQQVPVIGLNATRDMVRMVGMSPLEALDEEARQGLPEFDLNDPYHSAMTETIFSDHNSGKSMLAGFQRIQTLWDETMAENIAKTLRQKGPDHHMVVMAGGYHVRYGFGIPRRVYRRLPASYVLVGSRELVVPDEKKNQLMNVELPRFPMPPFDYLMYTEYESLPGERVKLGVRMTDEEGSVLVEDVVPNSAAANAGVQAGDIILALGESTISENFDLIYAVSQYTSGDQSKLIIEREGEQLELELTFIPLSVSKGHGKATIKK